MRRLPGDLTEEQDVEGMIRVDHAGEYGAMRIYAGQLAVMPPSAERDLVAHMAEQERRHFDTFNMLMKQRKVRPTLLMPLWHIAGFALGAATARMGGKAAFACTAAVESVINGHYAAQKSRLGDKEQELAGVVETFRIEEMEHHDAAIAHGAEEAPLYPLLSGGIKLASRLAIWLSARI
jgi:ubiquinone biosynthesis monooxygenase Coq7